MEIVAIESRFGLHQVECQIGFTLGRKFDAPLFEFAAIEQEPRLRLAAAQSLLRHAGRDRQALTDKRQLLRGIKGHVEISHRSVATQRQDIHGRGQRASPIGRLEHAGGAATGIMNAVAGQHDELAL